MLSFDQAVHCADMYKRNVCLLRTKHMRLRVQYGERLSLRTTAENQLKTLRSKRLHHRHQQQMSVFEEAHDRALAKRQFTDVNLVREAKLRFAGPSGLIAQLRHEYSKLFGFNYPKPVQTFAKTQEWLKQPNVQNSLALQLMGVKPTFDAIHAAMRRIQMLHHVQDVRNMLDPETPKGAEAIKTLYAVPSQFAQATEDELRSMQAMLGTFETVGDLLERVRIVCIHDLLVEMPTFTLSTDTKFTAEEQQWLRRQATPQQWTQLCQRFEFLHEDLPTSETLPTNNLDTVCTDHERLFLLTFMQDERIQQRRDIAADVMAHCQMKRTTLENVTLAQRLDDDVDVQCNLIRRANCKRWTGERARESVTELEQRLQRRRQKQRQNKGQKRKLSQILPSSQSSQSSRSSRSRLN